MAYSHDGSAFDALHVRVTTYIDCFLDYLLHKDWFLYIFYYFFDDLFLDFLYYGPINLHFLLNEDRSLHLNYSLDFYCLYDSFRSFFGHRLNPFLD
jgi:hypothetical protein